MRQPRDIIDESLVPSLSYQPDLSTMFKKFENHFQAPNISLQASPPCLEGHFIPLMSAEGERVFSSAGQLLTQQRNWLLDEIVETNEWLLLWRRAE